MPADALRSGWALPIASGLLLVAAFPPFHLLVPPFVAWVPFAVWVARLPATGSALATRGGLLVGVLLHASLLHWIVPALAWTAGLAFAVPAFLLVVGVLSGLTAAFGWTLHRAVVGGIPIWLALPVTWTATEWLQAHLPAGLAFPWLGLGTSLTAFPDLVGIAEIVGARGVSFWLVLVNGLAAAAWLGRGTRRRFLAAALLAALLPAAWGVARARTLETRAVARVAVVVTDLPASARRDPVRWNALASDAIEEALGAFPPRAVDLIVLPEGILMSDSEPGSDSIAALPGLEKLRRLAEATGARVLFGAYLAESSGPERNAVLGMAPDGLMADGYAKRRLVPWVEWGADRSPSPVGGWPRASEDQVWGGPHGAPGLLICFEAAFAEASRTARLGGADLLVNVSNDAWFGESGGLGRLALGQHAAHLVMRAIETRIGAVRSANGGYAFFVDPLGRVYGRAARTEAPTTRVAAVRTTDGRTPFVRFGDVLGPTSVLASLLFAFAATLAPRRAR